MRIFFDKQSGVPILEIQPQNGKIDTVERNIEQFTILSERNRETFEVIEYDYKQFLLEIAECNGYRVNPETKKLEFSYHVPGEPDAPQVFGPPLTEQIEGLKQENTFMMLALAEISEDAEINKTNTQLALIELAEMMIGGIE